MLTAWGKSDNHHPSKHEGQVAKLVGRNGQNPVRAACGKRPRFADNGNNLAAPRAFGAWSAHLLTEKPSLELPFHRTCWQP